ncbi:hypothetical protein GPECTOR_7g1009 [Gonium pectorale]|uniref:Uncharacterized protein n=1 Tax=Gonium pectorale TaxID=33097 RepID=A0A150GTG6_GONPE|nr:hypothetical protein GPECTOR_7g1009 [Gonium pectorale]|eukprot:KXZ53119.1 hypothetical protein GPECTOR_7g1009 [Gonium pectorale]
MMKRPINDKEESKGFPPAGWCRPPVVTSPDDAPAVMQAALQGASPAVLELAPPTDPIRLFYAAKSWCYVSS